MENINKIELIGTIVSDVVFDHEIFGEKFYSFSLETNRLSETNDVLAIIVSERLADVNALASGTRVSINGQLRSYNVNDEALGRTKLMLKTFVKEITIVGDEEADKNEVELNGFVCKPTIYRETPKGREICDVFLAVNRNYRKSDYIPTICWGRNAKYAKDLGLGDGVSVTGRLQSRQYTKVIDGEPTVRTTYEVSVSKIEIVVATTEVEETEPTE